MRYFDTWCTVNCGCGWSVGVVGVVGMVLLPIFPCIPSKFPPSAAIAQPCMSSMHRAPVPACTHHFRPPTHNTCAHTNAHMCAHNTHNMYYSQNCCSTPPPYVPKWEGLLQAMYMGFGHKNTFETAPNKHSLGIF